MPFHLVTGKRLPCRSTQVVITLKPVSHCLFDKPSRGQAQPNRITLQLQPNENIQLGLLSSLAGPEWGALELQPLALELSVPTGQQRRIAYERLFLDALSGNSALFVRADEVRAARAHATLRHGGNRKHVVEMGGMTSPRGNRALRLHD